METVVSIVAFFGGLSVFVLTLGAAIRMNNRWLIQSKMEEKKLEADRERRLLESSMR